MSGKIAVRRCGAGLGPAAVVLWTLALSGCGAGHKTGDRVQEYPEAVQATKSMEDFMKNKPAGAATRPQSDMEKFMKNRR